MKYDSNSKHGEPWQPGRRGTLCPSDVKPHAQAILDASKPDGKARYGVYEGKAYCARQHQAGLWHGWPVGWKEVPEAIAQEFRREGKVRRRQQNRYWDA